MSPRASNRDALVEGALHCLEHHGYAAVRTRDIAKAASANLASIGYHFGSKDELLSEALREAFRRWLAEFARAAVQRGDHPSPRERLRRVSRALRATIEERRGLALAFLDAVVRAPRDDRLREALAESYREARRSVADLLDLGDDETGRALASSLIANFDGLLIQWMLEPGDVPGDAELLAGLDRLDRVLTEPTTHGEPAY